MKLISFAIAATACLSPVYGQSQAVVPAPNADIVVEVAEQTGCPLKLSTKLLASQMMPTVDIAPSTVSDKPIIGYILVENGGARARIFGIARPGEPVEKDKENRAYGMTAFEQKRLAITVDYVEFVDGSSWGEDVYKQSGRIKQFVRGFNLAMDRLRDVAAKYEDPEFFIRRGMLSGSSIWSGPVAMNGKFPTFPENIEDTGYDMVLRNLRLRFKRDAEAQEIARKLELMHTPPPTDK